MRSRGLVKTGNWLRRLLILLPGLVTAGAAVAADAPLTLDRAVDLALQHSAAVQRAGYERQANLAAAQRDRPRFAPAVSLQGAGMLNGPRLLFPRDADGEATVTPRSRLRMELTAEATLYHVGAASAARRARAEETAADLGYEQARLDVRRDVAHAYFALLEAEGGLAVAQEGLTHARAHRRLVDDLVQAGHAARIDQLQGDVEVEQSATDAADAADARDLAVAALRRLLGQSVALASPEMPPLALAPVSEPCPPPDLAPALAAAEQRPDIRTLAAQVQVAEAGARLARSQTAPSLNLTGGYALQTPSAFVARSSWNTALTLVVPIGGRAQAKADAQEATAHAGAARSALEELRQGAALEVRQALSAIRSAQRRRESAARAVTAATEALRISELRFQAGRATSLEVEAAGASLNRVRLDELRALYDWHVGLADLEHATGAPAPESP